MTARMRRRVSGPRAALTARASSPLEYTPDCTPLLHSRMLPIPAPMPRSKHPHVATLANEFNCAPTNTSHRERLATAVARSALERSTRARAGDPPTAPGRAAALLVRHHVDRRYRQAS
jgi:hypothetical protein